MASNLVAFLLSFLPFLFAFASSYTLVRVEMNHSFPAQFWSIQHSARGHSGVEHTHRQENLAKQEEEQDSIPKCNCCSIIFGAMSRIDWIVNICRLKMQTLCFGVCFFKAVARSQIHSPFFEPLFSLPFLFFVFVFVLLSSPFIFSLFRPFRCQTHWTEKPVSEMTTRDWRIFREERCRGENKTIRSGRGWGGFDHVFVCWRSRFVNITS